MHNNEGTERPNGHEKCIHGPSLFFAVVNLRPDIFNLNITDQAIDGDKGFQPLWTTAGTTTTRIIISCGVPPTVENSEVQRTGIHEGDIAIYQCRVGYILSGNSTTVCKSSGEWVSPPTCLGM